MKFANLNDNEPQELLSYDIRTGLLEATCI